MLQNLWKMKGSNSKILQRQLKFQNAANSKENGQKSWSKENAQNGKTNKTIPDPFTNGDFPVRYVIVIVSISIPLLITTTRYQMTISIHFEYFFQLAIVEVVEAWSGWIHGCNGCRTNNLGYPWIISGFANWKITMFKGSIIIVYHFFLWAMASIAMFPWPLEATGRNSATSEVAGRDNTLRSRVRLGTGERA